MGRCVVFFIVMVVSVLSTTAEGDILVYSQDFRIIEEEFRDMPAKFGPTISTDGLKAFVIAGQPKNGCSPLAKRPMYPNFTGKWVVLLARYNCSFEEKIRAAQVAGYDGVIVHNVNSNNLEVMSAKNPINITIPSVFIGEDAGIIIELNYQYNYSYFVVINGDLPFNINNLLMPFSIVVVLCLIIMSVFMITKCIRDRRRARRHRLPNSALKKIPTSKFAKGDPYDTCAICLDDYVEGDKLRVLPCSHAYHCKCIDPWLTKNRRVCPVCKRKVCASRERRPRRQSTSGSDSDDDRDPLVASPSGNNTQGGTFSPQAENPFTRASREAAATQNTDTSSGTSRDTTARGSSNDGRQRGSWPQRTAGSLGGPFLAGVLNLKGRFNRSRNEERQPLTSEDLSVADTSQLFFENETAVESNNSANASRKRTRNGARIPNTNSQSGQSSSTQHESISSNESAGLSNIDDEASSLRSLTDKHSINDGDSGDGEDVTYTTNVGHIGVAALPNTNNQGPV